MNNHRNKIIILLGPVIAVFLIVYIVPLILAFMASLTDWQTGTAKPFTGLENYAEILTDQDFRLSLKNNLIIIAYCVVFQILISFGLSLFLTSKKIRRQNIHTSLIFIPVLISPVIIAILWRLLLDNNSGVIAVILQSLNLESLIKPWLHSPRYAIHTISVVVVWQYIGIYLIIFISSLQQISAEIFEAAEVDGAGPLTRIRYITLPLLKDTFNTVLVLCIAGGIKIFDHIYVMTGGGPAKSTNVLAMYAYKKSFISFRIGYGSAVSISMIVISLALIFLFQVLMRRHQSHEE